MGVVLRSSATPLRNAQFTAWFAINYELLVFYHLQTLEEFLYVTNQVTVTVSSSCITRSFHLLSYSYDFFLSINF